MIAIGRLRDPPLQSLIDRYLERCTWPVTIDERQPKSGARGAEAKLLLDGALGAERCIALDERGRDLGSGDLALRLRDWRDEGCRDLAILIGGADGLDAAVRQQADLLLAFGKATWPHMLVRLMLAEQLFRAGTILANHPYHRG